MLSVSNLSHESIGILQSRGRSDQQIIDFSALLEKAHNALAHETPAKEILSNFSDAELHLIQKTAGLVDRINVDSLSNEGAINLLAQPDKTGMIDQNNDGIVEIGVSRMVTFPPVNAPLSVKLAWNDATEGMSEQDKMVMELNMHSMVYGTNIDGISSHKALPPEEQWSNKGIEELFINLRSALAFSVSLDGWERFNLVKKDFYDKFESAIEENHASGRQNTESTVIT